MVTQVGSVHLAISLPPKPRHPIYRPANHPQQESQAKDWHSQGKLANPVLLAERCRQSAGIAFASFGIVSCEKAARRRGQAPLPLGQGRNSAQGRASCLCCVQACEAQSGPGSRSPCYHSPILIGPSISATSATVMLRDGFVIPLRNGQTTGLRIRRPPAAIARASHPLVKGVGWVSGDFSPAFLGKGDKFLA
jgi:hypothetical protein